MVVLAASLTMANGPMHDVVTFSDVTKASGITFTHTSSPDKRYILESMSGGVALFDYDRDGWLDVYLVNAPTVSQADGPRRARSELWRNRGDGTFADVTDAAGVGDPGWGMGAVAADYDNDGWWDLYVTCYGPNHLYRNIGDGTFADVSAAAGVNDPEGRFGMGASWFDVDDDGRPDLFVANDAGPNFLYRNRGNGTFVEVGLLSGTALSEDGREQGSMGVAVGDYDRSGRWSLFVTNFADEYNALYRHERDFTFSDVSYASRTAQASLPYVGWGAHFLDYDNDGWLDLLAVNGHVYPQVEQAGTPSRYAQRKLLYRSNRDGTFTEAGSSAGAALGAPMVSRGSAAGDLDNDGDLDLVVNNLDGPPTVLRNDGGNRAGYLVVDLEGRSTNRSAVGAVVTVTAGDLVQRAERRAGASYLSHDDVRLHFGLGPREKVDAVAVRWPDGSVQRFADVQRNTFVKIVQGATALETVRR